MQKALLGFATCLLVDNKLCWKIVSPSELPIIFDDSLKTTSVSFFIAAFSLLHYECDNVYLDYCIESFCFKFCLK